MSRMTRTAACFCSLVLLTSVGAPAGSGAVPRTGIVFHDRNANGTRDAGETGIAGVVVSNQADVVRTEAGGAFTLPPGSSGLVWVSVPDGYRSVGSFWRTTGASASASSPSLEFGLTAIPRVTSYTFVHASDTHVSEPSVARMALFRAVVDAERPAFVVITGDLVRDALRVSEAEATGYYELFKREAARFSVPLWTVPGNHEVFGIERDKSQVAASHPMYGRAMYRHHLGPDYYSFTSGGIHFVGLNSVDIEDQWYYGHVDAAQLAWLARDLAFVPATMPVVTFNHIPFVTTGESVHGYSADPPAPSLITIGGQTGYRHAVSNVAEVLELLKGHPYPIALGGHVHMREAIQFAAVGVATRFHQSAAVVGDNPGGVLTMKSGVTVYQVRNGAIDEGRFVPLEAVR